LSLPQAASTIAAASRQAAKSPYFLMKYSLLAPKK
jgi:hypothetical protein